MKVSSYSHSFTLLALSFLSIQFASSLSIDSKDVAHLQPRLDGGAVGQDASSSSSPTRRRKKCSMTPSVSGAAMSTSSPNPVPTTLAASIAGLGNSAQNNTSTLGNSLSYARSYKTKCSKKTGTAQLPVATGAGNAPSSGGNTGSSGSSGGGSNNPGSNDNSNSQSPAAGSNDGQAPVADGSSGCGLQSTVTVTAQQTVTVTQVAQAADSAGLGGGSPNTALVSSPQESTSAASGSGGTAPDNAPNGGTGAALSSASKRPTRTKCASGKASSTGVAGGVSGLGSSSSNSTSPVSPVSGASGSGSSASNSTTGTSGPESSNSASTPGSPGSESNTSNPSLGSPSSGFSTSNSNSSNSGSGSSMSGPPYSTGNSTSGNPSPSQVIGLPVSSNPSISTSLSNDTVASTGASNGEFWAGATIGTVMRMEAIPERKFYDFDGVTVKDPIKTLGDAGVNALRIEGMRGQCLGPTNFVNNASTLANELLFTLDWGCLDVQVQTAQRGVAQGMKVVLTINQGFDIPEGMESYTYEQMVGEVQKEAKRQLQPFLDVKIVPDVILLENEGSDGFLYKEPTTGHVRGNEDGKVSKEQLDKERCGQVPTGNMVSYAQYAGYLKAEVIACNEAIKAAGLSTDTVRYGLHSHGQYVQWKEAVVHGPNQANDTELKDSSGNICSNSVIPQDLLAQNVSQVLTILGFSAYPDPMTPSDINDKSSEEATLDRLTKTLTQLQSYAEAYGKYESGPFAGQYKLQSLGVEYGTSYTEDQIPQEQEETALMWETVKKFSNLLGILWYEPWYCHGDWEGGKAALCRKIDSKAISGQAPTNTLTTWGKAAISPWKK